MLCLSPHIFLERVHDEGLQLAQTLIDARTSPLFHDWFGGLEIEKKKKSVEMTVSKVN